MQFIGKKAAYALSQNVKLIACIGELLEEREAGKTFDVCFKQMKAFAGEVSSSKKPFFYGRSREEVGWH
jgi:triosephosphate isomerase